MKKFISLAITLTLSALALLSVLLWHQRHSLSYNDQGRFFDVTEGVVYKDSAVVFYAMLALLFAALGMAAAMWTLRVWRR